MVENLHRETDKEKGQKSDRRVVKAEKSRKVDRWNGRQRE
jgi:hypothetical protein